MEQKKSSTLGKAFSRAFGRKTAPTPPPLETAKQEVPPTTSAPTSAPNKGHIVIDTRPPVGNTATREPPTLGANGVGAPILTDGHPTLPFDTATVSAPYSAGVAQSPPLAFIPSRDETNLSRSSTQSRPGAGLSDTEATSNFNNPEGGLNPANILLDRLIAYHAVVKNLQQYFNEIAIVEQSVAKAMHKASTTIVLPFKDGHQFLGKGGLQDVCVGVRESAQARSEQHTAAARFVEEIIVKNIRRLKQDIKVRSKGLRNDSTLCATRVFKEREVSQEKIGNLAKAIGLFENVGGHQSDMERIQSDPYLINLSLRHQLTRQVHEENTFARALLQNQEQIMMFEKHVINEIKQIIRNFAQYQLNNAGAEFSQSWAATEGALSVLHEDTEWNHFMGRNGHLLLPSDLVDVDLENLDYPCKNSPYVTPVKTAHMSRQSSVLKNWKDGYFVLTMAGWLHVFASADIANDPMPERSIYLPTAILGPHSDPAQKQHVFSLEGKGMGGLLHREAQVFTIRANSREEMLDWWNEISKRAYSTTFIHQSDGSLLRSSTVQRAGSRIVKPDSPGAGVGRQEAPAPLPVPAPAPAPAYDSQQQQHQQREWLNQLRENPAAEETVAPIDTAPHVPAHEPAHMPAPAPAPTAAQFQQPVPVTAYYEPSAAEAPQTNGGFQGGGAPATTVQAADPGMSNQVFTHPPKLQRYDTGSTASLSTGEPPVPAQGGAVGPS
ncbi:hypothetical protein BGZ65_002362 [Modicella reniformis]|uniref:PH domain-containing protein n=1 Tax=Modicella reniformis TaxID=1440133 RepID=A0A9P6LZG6_9FUNG|nr:hypothetical protein BGZ65_002362 [Modicella reniformis]